MGEKNSEKSTPTSPAQTLSWLDLRRISIARLLLRSARSIALWLAPELRDEP